jgi:hypothetical protein
MSSLTQKVLISDYCTVLEQCLDLYDQEGDATMVSQQ